MRKSLLLGAAGFSLLSVIVAACASGSGTFDAAQGDTSFPDGDDEGQGMDREAGPIGLDANDATAPGDTSTVSFSDAASDGNDDALDAPGCDANGPLQIPPTGTDTFTPSVNPRWAMAGSTNINVTQVGWARLTPAEGNQAGALWWNETFTFDQFDVTFMFQIDNNPSGADGISFGWVPGADVTQVGNDGAGLGIVGLGGWGVAIDTYQNSGDPPAPYLMVVDSAGDRLTTATIPDVRDGQSHTMRIQFQTPTVTVWIDSNQYVGFSIPNYVPFVGHWGFTAATGSSYEQHFVTGISMTFPSGEGCAE